MSLSPTRRKQLQRQRDQAAGWVEVTVKVAQEHADRVRAFAVSLPPPSPPTDPRQLDLLARIEAEMVAASNVQPDLFS